MGCIRSHSRIWVSAAVGLVGLALLSFPSNVWAAFASQFSLSVGEHYTDNVFFEKQKDHDFITVITPTLSLYYAPQGQVEPTLNLNISPSGYIYARHSELNGFGANSAFNLGYTYQYSPRLNFSLSDTFSRQDQSRTGGLGGGFQAPGLPTTGGGLSSQNLKDLVSGGTQASNTVHFRAAYLYRPDVSFTAEYTNQFESFVSQGGTDVFNTASVRGIYNWRQDHNLHAGYTVEISKSRNGDNCSIHKFDLGDDYFSNYTLQLTPTLSLSASTGLSLNLGNASGCSDLAPVANNTSVTITKLWETAFLTAGFQKGFTPSFGVSGISDTMTLFTNFTTRLTEKVTATSNLNFSLYDTSDVNFKTFQIGLGLQYAINTWLSTNLNYYFNLTDGGAGATSTDLISKGVVNSNAVFLTLTSRFDLWPNVGLARSISPSAATPVLKTPFPSPAPPSTTPSLGPTTSPGTGPAAGPRP